MRWLRHLFHHDPARIPEPLWHACTARLPFLARLPAADLARLKALCETILDAKTFTGAAGFVPSDEIAVLIAAQAALPVLNLSLDLYDDMTGIIIYPSAFLVARAEVDEAGIVHESRPALAGEAIGVGGAVILSWEDVERNDAAGGNVVIHEFAHKIDMADGSANGCPPFLAGYHQAAERDAWKGVFSAAYDDFRHRLAQRRAHLPHDFDVGKLQHAAHHAHLRAPLPLDPYASSNPAEFFAVASETFFVHPKPLADAYPDVFRLLAMYYRQDPLTD